MRSCLCLLNWFLFNKSFGPLLEAETLSVCTWKSRTVSSHFFDTLPFHRQVNFIEIRMCHFVFALLYEWNLLCTTPATLPRQMSSSIHCKTTYDVFFWYVKNNYLVYWLEVFGEIYELPTHYIFLCVINRKR